MKHQAETSLMQEATLDQRIIHTGKLSTLIGVYVEFTWEQSETL